MKAWVECWSVAVAIGVLSACGSTAGPEEMSGTGGTADSGQVLNFCPRWVESFAAYLELCGCGPKAAARYREQTQNLCAAGQLMQTNAVVNGDLTYDPVAAEALFARLQAPNPLCVRAPYRALGLDSREVYSLAGTFKGTHALGEACTIPVSYKGGVSDCREGVCAPSAANRAVGQCIALVGEGQPCQGSGDHEFGADTARLCHETRLADTDGEYESAFDGLSCLAPEAGATRVCVSGIANGGACNSSDACSSGRCGTGSNGARVCVPKSAAGEPCQISRECETGACQYGLEPHVCGALLAEGADCGYDDAACASGSCVDYGTSRRCGPLASAVLGAACRLDDDCVSRTCRGGLCVADACGPYLD